MRFRLMVTGILAMLLSACVTTHQVQRGTNNVTVGEVPASKVLIYTGGTVGESLRIQADENGNATIIAGQGLVEMIPMYLSPAAITELDAKLAKMIEWGDISLKNNIETTKPMDGFLIKSFFSDGPVSVTPVFISGKDGKGWVGNLQLAQLRSQEELLFGQGHKLGDIYTRQLSIFMQPESVVQLRKILARIPDYSTKAATSKSRSELLK